MGAFVPLAAMGNRILVLGPSTSGKSSLAEAISDKLGIAAVHLDQLHHQPNTDWQPRPKEEFLTLLRQAVAGDSWVMDGNYSGLLPERFTRATGAVVLDDTNWTRLARYLRRTLFEPNRAGMLEGGKDSVKWSMIHWVLIASRHGGARYREMITTAGLPHVFCRNMAELQMLYAAWDLRRRAR